MKILICGAAGAMGRAVAAVAREYGHEPAAGVDKAFGIRRLAGLFGVEEGSIYSAGDQMNDFAMVDAFYGFAMEGAPEALSAAAEKTVSDVGEALEMIMRGEV